MLKQASSLFRNEYWLVLNLPYFVGALVMGIATYDQSLLLTIFLILVNLISAIAFFHLGYLFSKENKCKHIHNNREGLTIRKQITGKHFAIAELIVGMVTIIPNYDSKPYISFALFLGIAMISYIEEVGSNRSLLPAYCLTIVYPCFIVSIADNYSLAYVTDTESIDYQGLNKGDITFSWTNSDAKTQHVTKLHNSASECLLILN